MAEYSRAVGKRAKEDYLQNLSLLNVKALGVCD